MKSSRILNLWWLGTLVTQGSALTLLEALQSYPELSALHSRVNASSNLTSLLASANNFTFLAPTNSAIESFISQNRSIPTEELFAATVQYSLLRGGFPELSFSNTSQFVTSNLANASYANVTGGQVVELVLGTSGKPQVVTGNRSISTTTSTDIICAGGIVHIIDNVLAVPVATVLQIPAAHLEFFTSILAGGGYLSTENSGYVHAILDIPDITYFIPNSAGALENFQKLAENTSAEELKASFQYHVVPGFIGYSPLLTNGMTLKTAQGSNVTVTIQDDEMYINAAHVIATDYIVSNGVVHVIDDLLNRFDTSPPPTPSPRTSTVATSTPVPTPIPTAITSASATPQSSDSKSDTPKLKIGLGVGIAAAGLLILGALIWFLRSRKQAKDSGAWDDQGASMSGAPHAGFYNKRATAQRQGDLGFGVQSTGMHGIQSNDFDSKNVPSYSVIASGPSIPPRSPSRLMQGNEF